MPTSKSANSLSTPQLRFAKQNGRAPNHPMIGITMGDPGGIGPEVTAKALRHPSLKNGSFKIIGDYSVLSRFTKSLGPNCDFIDLNILNKRRPAHTITFSGGRASLAYLQAAVELLKAHQIQSLVTAPVSKQAIGLANPSFVGHTEYFADHFGIKNVGMMFVCDGLRVVIATRHIALKKVSAAINPNTIFETIGLVHRSLRNLFKIPEPKIAVCGLNPHAGEGGLLGKEETTKIVPAILKAREAKINVYGPLSADTLFYPTNCKPYDAVIAMYHDQGLTPVKALYFNRLVNLTVGLPFIRTSPAHGTAFDIAGKNKADPSSMIEAIRLAVKLTS